MDNAILAIFAPCDHTNLSDGSKVGSGSETSISQMYGCNASWPASSLYTKYILPYLVISVTTGKQGGTLMRSPLACKSNSMPFHRYIHNVNACQNL